MWHQKKSVRRRMGPDRMEWRSRSRMGVGGCMGPPFRGGGPAGPPWIEREEEQADLLEENEQLRLRIRRLEEEIDRLKGEPGK